MARLPKLKLLHSKQSLSLRSLEYWRMLSSEEIVRSLGAAASNPLVIKPDGTIMDGNTRVTILLERRFDIGLLSEAVIYLANPEKTSID